MLKMQTFSVGPLFNNCYLVWEEPTLQCAIIDAPIGSEVVVRVISSLKLSPVYLINTHCHFDHVFNNAFFKEEFNLKLAYHKMDEFLLVRLGEASESFGFSAPRPSPLADEYIEEGTELWLGAERISVIETPGHSPGSVSLLTSLGAFVGDVLFKGGIGRYDLPGSEPSQLYRSITEKLFELAEDTCIFPGHGEQTTVYEEKRNNPFPNFLRAELGLK